MNYERADHRLEEAVREAAAAFVARSAGPQSLITVTRVAASDHGRKVTIYISVFPTKSEDAALDFLVRQKEDLFDFMRKRVALSRLPSVQIELDRGEANRQTVDELLSP